MISPDRSDVRIVPDEQIAGAQSANWEPAKKMVHPQTQDSRWVPSSQVEGAQAAGYVDPSVPAASSESHPFQGLGSALTNTTEGLLKSGVIGTAQDAYRGITEDIPAVFKTYEAARKTGASIMDAYNAADAKAREINDAKNQLTQAVKQFQTNPNQAAWSAVLQLGMIALGGKLSGGEAGEAAGATATEGTVGAEAVSKPGIVKQVMQGEKVAQAPAVAAIRQGVQSGTEAAGTADESVAANIENQPIVKGPDTILDEHLSALKDKESAAYKRVDDTVGFDLKAEKAQMGNDKYKLSQLGNTDADVTQRGNLIESINDSQQRITDAEAQLKRANIDPAAADAIHQRRMATQDIRKSFIKNTDSDGNIKIEGLLNDTKNLRTSKWGDRYAQAWNQQAAERFQNQLVAARDRGVAAVNARVVAKWAGSLLGVPTVAGAGYAAVKGIKKALD
jgi:hypothetical protein